MAGHPLRCAPGPFLDSCPPSTSECPPHSIHYYLFNPVTLHTPRMNFHFPYLPLIATCCLILLCSRQPYGGAAA